MKGHENTPERSMKRDEFGQYELDIYTPADSFSKSNTIINSKYKATLLEQKLLNIMLSRLQMRNYIDGGEKQGLVCSIRANELKKMLGTKSGSIYEKLKPAAAAMTSRIIGFEDDEKQAFKYISLVTAAEYQDGVFTVHFNYELKQYLTPQTQFTILDLPVILQYRGVYSLRLHELLLSRCYRKKRAGVSVYTGRETDGRHFAIEFSVSELKLSLGVVNAENFAVQRILNGSPIPDYDKAVERAQEKSFNNWNDFKKRVLDPAVNEINVAENNIHVEYELQKGGKGGRVYGIIFLVVLGSTQSIKMKKTGEDRRDFIDDVLAKIQPLLPVDDVRAICEAADYDINKIDNAIEILNAAGDIDNVTGFLIKAVKNNYSRPVKKSAGKNAFHNFEQRDYDFDEFERKLLKPGN